MQNNCPHRGASLFFGRNEEAGLRCVYHGWKFDVDGNCIDMPNEPAESDFKSKVKAVAYPTARARRRRLGLYGRRDDAAAAAGHRAEHGATGRTPWPSQQDHNWLQVLEGTIDTIHAGFLHCGSMQRRGVSRRAPSPSAMLRRAAAAVRGHRHRRLARATAPIATPRPARTTGASRSS